MLKNLRLNPSIIFDNDFQKNELKNTVIRGSMALVISQGLSFGLSMINVLILARLLTPEDFGIIGMVTVVINFLAMFKDAGLSMATVQSDKIESQQISTLFWINALISLTMGVIILISSPLVSSFYNKPKLTLVTAVLALPFMIQGITLQHSALLQRHLKFTTIAIIDILGQLSNMIVAILMASFGFSYWALVGGSITRALVIVIFTFLSCPWLPGSFRKGTGVRGMLKFGSHLTASNFVGYLSRNLDSILIGKFIGAEAVGLYSRAFTLLMQPLNQIRAPLNALAMPVLSSLKNQPERYQNYFRQLLDISISLTLPITVFCFLESDFLIRLLLGEKWLEAAPVFKLLAIGGVFISTSVAPGLVMLSHGFSKRYFNLTLVTAIIISSSFIVGIPFGIKGVAIAYSIANFLIMIPLIIFGFRGTHIKIQLILVAMRGPVIAALIAGAFAYIYIYFYKEDHVLNHIITGIIFFLIYFLLTILRPKTRETFRSIIETFFSKRKKAKEVLPTNITS